LEPASDVVVLHVAGRTREAGDAGTGRSTEAEDSERSARSNAEVDGSYAEGRVKSRVGYICHVY